MVNVVSMRRYIISQLNKDSECHTSSTSEDEYQARMAETNHSICLQLGPLHLRHGHDGCAEINKIYRNDLCANHTEALFARFEGARLRGWSGRLERGELRYDGDK